MTAPECRCTWSAYSARCPHAFHAAIALRPAPLPASVPDVDEIEAAWRDIISREFGQ